MVVEGSGRSEVLCGNNKGGPPVPVQWYYSVVYYYRLISSFAVKARIQTPGTLPLQVRRQGIQVPRSPQAHATLR